jgi:hypothetical protein
MNLSLRAGKRMKARLTMAVMFAALVTCVTQARATVYDWSYQDASNSGSGTLTTSDAGSPYVTIEFMSGVFDGRSISTLVSPGFCCGPLPSDNYLYTSGGALLDGKGLAFNTSDGSNYYYYSIAFANNDGYAVTTITDSVTINGTFTATPQLGVGSPVPEPASAGMVLAGFAGLFTLLARARRSAAHTGYS